MDYIKAIADARSISAAASNLGISQPALSAHLKKKEKELGVTLFDRSKQPLQLTDSGRVYLEYAEKMAALENEFHQKVTDIEDLNTGELTVGGAGYFNVAYIPKALAVFSRRHPNVRVKIVDGNIPYITAEAWKGLIDLLITPNRNEEDRFHYEELADEIIYLAVPQDWKINQELSGKAVNADNDAKALTKAEFRNLCKFPFVVLKESQDVGRKMEMLFDHYGCRPEQIIRAEQTMTTYALTSAGVGISLITRNSVERADLAGGPVLYKAEPGICSRKIYVAYPKSKYLSKAAREFIDILKEETAYAR